MKIFKPIYIFIIIFSILLFDLIAYNFVPRSLTTFAPMYNYDEPKNVKKLPNIPEIARRYPRNYHVKDEILGFKIQENITGIKHNFIDSIEDVFSNDLGCFDIHSLNEIKSFKNFEYLTGDSAGWGYVDLKKKFSTIYENNSKKKVLKCAITHSGQIHQFKKFKRDINIIKKYPKRVIVVYSYNDPANDHTFPHTTVIEGFKTNTKYVDKNYNVKNYNMNNKKKLIDLWMSQDHSIPFTYKVRRFIQKYFLSANLVNYIKNRIRNNFTEKKKREDFSIYKLNEISYFDERYLKSLVNKKNIEIIRTWKNDSLKFNYDLIFILVPPKNKHNKKNFYSGLMNFLDVQNIKYINLSGFFERDNKEVYDVYWKIDGHFNESGNIYVGNLLTKYIK